MMNGDDERRMTGQGRGRRDRSLSLRQFYALIWKDFVVHKRHHKWTLLEITVPVLVCALAILSNSHPGKPKLESERVFDPDDFERIYGELNPTRHRLLVAPNSSFTRALVDQIDDGAVTVELCNSEAELVELIKQEIPVSLDQVKRLLPDDSANVTIGGVVIRSDEMMFAARNSPLKNSSLKPPTVVVGVASDDKLLLSKHEQQHQNGNRSDNFGGPFFEVVSKLDGSQMRIPINLDMAIRARDFRLGPEPFPKKYSLGPFLHSDHYQATFFMASQIMLSRAYINLLANYLQTNNSASDKLSATLPPLTTATTTTTTRFADIVIPTNEDLIGQKMPYPKYVAHKRLKETTLGTFVAGSQKQKPFVLTMDYCICIGFLVTAIFLAKRIVDEKKSRVRDMLRLVGISDLTYYGSHVTNTMLIMTVQCFLITLMFTGHLDAPAQNINSSLMFAILVIYCLSAIMFVLALSTLFSSSTKAIIFTSLLWLGLPEVIERIFKLNAGVIESSGFLAIGESYHLLFCLLPNFGLRLMNRLLTECDIYGEFFEKKQLYGEYRAIWPNLFSVLPLYKTITIAHIMGVMLLSVPFYVAFIYVVNSSKGTKGLGLASLSSEGSGSSSSASGFLKAVITLFISPLSCLANLLVALLKAPYKLLHHALGSFSSSSRSSSGSDPERDPSDVMFSSTQRIVGVGSGDGGRRVTGGGQKHIETSGNFNCAFTTNNLDNLNCPINQKHLMNNIELGVLSQQNSDSIKFANGKKGLSENMLDPGNLLLTSGAALVPPTAASCTKALLYNCERNEEDKNDGNNEAYFERAPGMLQRGVSIRSLSKTYFTSNAKLRRIDAVRNVSLDMFYSQILVLLGHNGAGKTTLIDIISGHNCKTSGTIHIDGFNIDTHPAEARRRVGFCPQFDVLFERLTVYEHLYFYGIVKGAKRELEDEINELLKQSGLDKHRDKLSKALSGGYKRKLSLAIAMIAKSRVLILDEPTSGMDPESRRKVWDFLQLIRNERLILMTTHHMEEADALGDRIAVMSSGQVKCCGSALFLKKVFNAGYHLRISKSSLWNQIAFEELIGIKYKLQGKLENVTPHELMYKFDVDETAQVLPALFDDLERQKERVGIFGFGVTVSTMDDVFMKIGLHFKDVEAQEMQSKFELANGIATKESTGSVDLTASVIKMNGAQGLSAMAGSAKERVEGNKLFRQHMRAMLAKRYHHARKNWFQLLWILSVSLACVASIVVLIDFVIFKEELTPEWSREMTLDGAGYGHETTGIFQFSPPAVSSAEELEALRDKAFPEASTTLSTTRSTASPNGAESTSSASEREPLTTPPAASSSLAPPVAQPTPSSNSNSSSDGETEALASGSTTPTTTTGRPTSGLSSGEIRRRRRRGSQHQTVALQPANSPQAGAAAADQLIEGRSSGPLNDSALFLERYWLNEAHRSGMKHLLTYTDVNTQMIDLLTKQFADFREKYIIGGEKVGKKYIVWYNGEATHSFPISMNIMLNSILKQFTDLIQESGHPMKGSRISLKHVAMAQINTLVAFLPHLGRLINLVFLPFSLAFITSYFVIFPTHERVTKSKHLQLMTGIPARTFWLSHFLFDLLLYLAYTVSVLAIYFVWDRVVNDRRIYFANFEHSVALIALVTLFIFGALPLAYIFSFIAKKPTSAFSSFCVLTILSGTATLTLVSLYELKYEHTATTGFKVLFTTFLWTARLIPSVSLLIGLQKLFALNTTRSICINVSPEVLDLLCRYISSPLIDEELRVLRPERCCKKVCQDECYDQWPFFWSGWFGVNIELAMLVFDACLFWLILVTFESRSFRARLMNAANRCLVPLKFIGFGEGVGGVGNGVAGGNDLCPNAGGGSFLLSKARKYCWRVPQFAADHTFGADGASSGGRARNLRVAEAGDIECALTQNKLKIDQIVQSRSTQNYSMVVNDLTKVYSANRFRAVDRLSFVVDKREFFGLLGVNGAGKSTTFKMLTGELRPTSGSAFIGSHDACNERTQYLKKIGYCPQQDALIDSLTGAQMLTLFARLRGLPEYQIKAAVEDTLEKLGLARIGHIDSGNYSGGNKRRLSVGMALIGAPEVIFLDEPTSGVDPRSRRRLWSTLIEFQKQTKSSIVMTSHSMNECECLCDRVAIMVGGQFKVLGSIQYLRTKLSRGFSLVLKMKPDSLSNLNDLNKSSELIQDYMAKRFATSQLELRDLHQTIIQYHVEPSSELSWSKMLLALEEAKRELDLEDYQITSDASLESIFLSLAKEQAGA